MLRLGRPRSSNKDLPLGVRIVAGRYYVRPVNESMRRVFAREFPGRATAALGDDKAKMRERWVKLFCAPESEAAPGTIGALLDRFLVDELPRANSKTGRPLYAPATQANYRGNVKRLRAEFGAWKFAKSEAEAVSGGFLRLMHVQAYLRKHERTRSQSANQDVVCLTTVFRFARQCGLTEFNPCAGVEYNPHVARTVVPSDDAFMAVYAKASPVLQCMMDLAQMCGARRGSIAAITLADIRDDGLRIVSNKTKRGHTPKETIYSWADEHGADNGLRAVVDRAIAVRSKRRGSGKVESIYLFLTTHGGKFSESALDSQWSRAIEQTTIERSAFHFHDIRAKTGTESEDDLQAMKRLAHTDIRTTRKVYRRKPDTVTPLRPVSGKKPAAGSE